MEVYEHRCVAGDGYEEYYQVLLRVPTWATLGVHLRGTVWVESKIITMPFFSEGDDYSNI